MHPANEWMGTPNLDTLQFYFGDTTTNDVVKLLNGISVVSESEFFFSEPFFF